MKIFVSGVDNFGVISKILEEDGHEPLNGNSQETEFKSFPVEQTATGIIEECKMMVCDLDSPMGIGDHQAAYKRIPIVNVRKKENQAPLSPVLEGMSTQTSYYRTEVGLRRILRVFTKEHANESDEYHNGKERR